MMLKIHMLSNRIVCSRLWARGISILHVISVDEQLTRKVNDTEPLCPSLWSVLATKTVKI